jgi:HSP20 family protein
MEKPDENVKTIFRWHVHRRFSMNELSDEAWHPLTDVFETDDQMLVRMELPGVKPGDIEVLLDGPKLTVKGVRHDAHLSPGTVYHRMEIHYGQFRRVVLLPFPADGETARAAYIDGFLEIRLPRTMQAGSRTIIAIK